MLCVYVLYVHPGGKEKSQSPPLLGAFAQEEGRPCVALFIKLFLASAIDRARCCAPSRHIQRGEWSPGWDCELVAAPKSGFYTNPGT